MPPLCVGVVSVLFSMKFSTSVSIFQRRYLSPYLHWHAGAHRLVGWQSVVDARASALETVLDKIDNNATVTVTCNGAGDQTCRSIIVVLCRVHSLTHATTPAGTHIAFGLCRRHTGSLVRRCRSQAAGDPTAD